MNLKSIRAKVVFACISLSGAALGVALFMMNYSFNHDAQMLAVQSVTGSQSMFAISEAREISKMRSVAEALSRNPQIGDALGARDRSRLLSLTAPLFTELKKEGITNWMFHTPEPDMTVFLRLHNPAKYGDHLDRFIDKEVVRTHNTAIGNELAKAGFALRIITPVYTSRGVIAGYVEFGEELGQFIHTMKAQTGDDYGLLLSKGYVNRAFWAESSAAWHRRDNWDDSPNTVIVDKTSDSDAIFRFTGDLASMSETGTVLERYGKGQAVYVRGIFSIKDASGKKVGAIFTVRDITALYLSMRHTEFLLAIVAMAGVLVATTFFVIMLNSLIFRRLMHMIEVATRVVGGDYGREIVVSSEDEVGQFERLFEQFRLVFMDVLAHVPELQEK